MRNDWSGRQLRRGVMVLGLIGLWALVSRFGPWPPYLPPGPLDVGQALLATGALEGSQLRDSYQAEAMNSVQGDPDGYTPELTAPEAEEDLISLPLLGRSTAAGHQRRLLALLRNDV